MKRAISQASRRTRVLAAWILVGIGASLLLSLGAWAWAAEQQLAVRLASAPLRVARDSPNTPVAFDAELSPAIRAALAREGDADRGRDAFASCAVCHLEDGAGRPDGIFPQLAGQHATVIIKQLVDMREGRRVNHLMLPYAERLSGPREVADLARYASGLDRPLENGHGSGSGLDVGGRLYGRDCASCHGDHGEGDASRFVPMLAGQHYGYMLRQIRDIGGGRRGNAHPEMVELAAGYSDFELTALVDYASRIRGEESGE